MFSAAVAGKYVFIYMIMRLTTHLCNVKDKKSCLHCAVLYHWCQIQTSWCYQTRIILGHVLSINRFNIRPKFSLLEVPLEQRIKCYSREYIYQCHPATISCFHLTMPLTLCSTCHAMPIFRRPLNSSSSLAIRHPPAPMQTLFFVPSDRLEGELMCLVKPSPTMSPFQLQLPP